MKTSLHVRVKEGIDPALKAVIAAKANDTIPRDWTIETTADGFLVTLTGDPGRQAARLRNNLVDHAAHIESIEVIQKNDEVVPTTSDEKKPESECAHISLRQDYIVDDPRIGEQATGDYICNGCGLIGPRSDFQKP